MKAKRINLKVKKLEIEDYLVIVATIVFMFLMMSYAFQEILEGGETIERCKEKGWDGARFIEKFSTQMECSNFTQAQKDALEEEND